MAASGMPGLRDVIFQCLFLGARANLSEYELEDPAPIAIEGISNSAATDATCSQTRLWCFDKRDGALETGLGLV